MKKLLIVFLLSVLVNLETTHSAMGGQVRKLERLALGAVPLADLDLTNVPNFTRHLKLELKLRKLARIYYLQNGEHFLAVIDAILKMQGVTEPTDKLRERELNKIYQFSIQELLDYHRLTEITDGRLDLSGRYITTLDGLQNIPGIEKLKSLRLHKNQLTELQPGAFHGLGNLEKLFLYNTQLTQIQPGTFNGLENLEVLRLAYNQITQLQPGAFQGLKNLRQLDLDHNQIKEIYLHTFQRLGNLEILHLYRNQITQLLPGAFHGLENLGFLYLRYNQIKEIHPHTFQGLEKLKVLDLEDNQLTQLLPDTFQGLGKLRWLNLNHNQISPALEAQIKAVLPANTEIYF